MEILYVQSYCCNDGIVLDNNNCLFTCDKRQMGEKNPQTKLKTIHEHADLLCSS